MRWSFQGNGVRGGSGGRGGRTLRSIQRAIRTGGGAPPEPFSRSAGPTTVSAADSREAKQLVKNQPKAGLSSNDPYNNCNKNESPTFSTAINFPRPGASAPATRGACGDDDVDWECLDVGDGDERGIASDYNFVFGTVPSRDEVNCAISALQQAFRPVSPAYDATEKLIVVENEDQSTVKSEKINSSSLSELDWIEPSPTLGNSRKLCPYGPERVYDAFHLLQSEPSVQRMVIALSSDRTVWEAVLNNEAVKEELRGSISRVNEEGDKVVHKTSGDDNNPAKGLFLSWFFSNAKEKITQLIDMMVQLANMVFQFANEEKKGGAFDSLQEKIKTSLFLSIAVLLIVVVNRAKSV
ncbi:Uncharacterised conserved protein (UCP012943 [Striga hermonthica]|uniref:Uncharacterized conserved protein (UCP012943) n=1 Tax=Striga hermonthica TaxID=68872 RepID=A0A9N7NQ65_STRHE|nr:Uncharacterised conserved protein (UCP012943 [Striga hermonthica]